MSKFCTTCGAQLDDNATFCTSCGTPQQEQPKQPETAPSAGDAVKNTFNDIKDKVNVNAVKDSLSMENIKNLKTNPNKTTLIALAVIAIVVILVVIIVLTLVVGGRYKKPITNMFNGMEKADAAKYLKSVPQAQLDYLEETVVDESESYDSVEEYYQEIVDSTLEAMEDEYGSDIKLSYDVERKSELSDRQLRNIRDNIENYYDANVEVTKGFNVRVEVTIKGDDDEETEFANLIVAKVDGDWVMATDLDSDPVESDTDASLDDWL